MVGFEIEVAGRLTPVSRVFCIGRNYADHMAELDSAGNQSCVIFMKPLTSLLSVGEPIVAPRGLGALHHEVELVVAIGEGGRDIAAEAGLEHVAGYGLGLDLTLRDLQHQLREDNAPWEVCKGFDGSAPISPFVGPEGLGDPTSVELACRVNGELRQACGFDTLRRDAAVPGKDAYTRFFKKLERHTAHFGRAPVCAGRPHVWI